jgi:hypothetical protein
MHPSRFPGTMPSDNPTTTCARCGTPGSGRFCTECGAPLAGAPCAGCGEQLTPGSRFCHHCGAAAGAAAGTVDGAATATPRATSGKGATLGTTLPWAVAGIAFLTLFAMLAGKGFNAQRGSTLDAPSNALPNPALDGAGAPSTAGSNTAADAMGAAAPFAGGAAGAGAVRAPDISKMSPTEIADRLFNRIMQLNDEGKSDSVAFFAPMAIQAYEMVEQQQGHPFDADQRYDIGRIAEVAGALPMAKAQADTILQQHPDHLLGLLLAAQVAKQSGNTPAEKEYATHFDRVKAGELAKKLPEYARHRREIDAGT